jgi:protein-L-isoaspartate(D-aspartate) O-methyltransferase
MVDRQLAGRDITNERVLKAFRDVPREAFLPENLREFAYEDSPLPIAQGQTISQPYIVALTVQALGLRGGERVLEVGTGSGYAAAILSRIAKDVYSVERLESLAAAATAQLARLKYKNVHVLCGDGTLGWPEHAPYDAIAVAAGGPEVPSALLAQLAVGGRLVIPVGPESEQVLVRITRTAADDYQREELTSVRFVPLIGAQGWPRGKRTPSPLVKTSPSQAASKLVREVAEPLSDIRSSELGGLLERIGEARLVLLGESTHGTSEFYRMRAHITRELIERRGFDFVAIEGDWPDVARVNTYVQGGLPMNQPRFVPFSRFPTWMWRNEETHAFIEWLRARNHERRVGERVGFHGLDLYSMFTSMAIVLAYLDDVDPGAARAARARYGMLTPWQRDPAAYGRAVLTGRYQSSEETVVAMLRELLAHRLEYSASDGERFFDAAQNARVVANAEHYYRAMYYASPASWNLRDSHMFETLQSLLAFYGPNSKGIVWAHNSHVGNALATEMSLRGEHNIGQLCHKKWENDCYVIGFSTDHGTVAAASDWDEPMQRMQVRPARHDSYERIFHDTDLPAFMLHLREPRRGVVKEELSTVRLERAIGVVYRPETERASHYFEVSLASQFDELIWFDETSAVEPLAPRLGSIEDFPQTYPFGT